MHTSEALIDDNMPDNGNKKSPRLDDLAASRIGKKLREQFDEILAEPVPDRFLDLLNKLESAEKNETKESGDE